MNYTIIDNWTLEIDGQKLAFEPPEQVRVVDERYERLPLYVKNGGWNNGQALYGIAACGCSLPYALDAYSVRVREEDGTLLKRGVDYEYTLEWGCMGRLENGSIAENQPVLISYRYTPTRLDSIAAGPDGKLRVVRGTPAVWCAKMGEIEEGEIRLATVYVDAQTDRLRPENVFPITETSFPPCSASDQQRYIKRTMEKLQAGEHVRILAWGDSVTSATYMTQENKWQEIFVKRLREKYPQADIELISNGWGGRTIPAFLREPEDSKYNYQRTVLDVKADLVVTEFVNDAGLNQEVWQRSFGKVLEDFRRQNTEWIILTPHYVRPDWMGMTTQNGPGIENDPRPYVAFIRKFTAENGVALADAAKRYGRLWRQGIPYNTLMTNTINHPDVRGMKIFVDALMSIFD